MRVPTGAILSKYLRALAMDIHTVDDDGKPVNKAAVLAKLVWQHALGFEERDPDDPNKMTPHKPATWAIELLFNRIEGKIPLAVVEDQGRSLAEKVSDLGKARANALANDVVARENAELGGDNEDTDDDS